MTLARLCEHGGLHPHYERSTAFPQPICPGGTVLDPDSLVIVKEDGEWPEWARRALGSFWGGWRDVRPMFDALAAAQRSSE